MKEIKNLWFVLAIVAIIALGILYFSLTQTAAPKEGDNALLSLTAKSENGTVVQNVTGHYKLSAEDLPPGLVREVLTMRAGETKNVVLTPEEGYGKYNFTLLKSVDRLNVRDRFQNFTLDEFTALTRESPEINKSYSLKDIPWPVKVLSVANTTVRMEHRPVFDSLYYDPLSTPWQLRIVGIDPDIIFFRYQPKAGATIIYQGERATVKEFDLEKIILDFNHPFAGRTLDYNIKLWNFTSTSAK